MSKQSAERFFQVQNQVGTSTPIKPEESAKFAAAIAA
jgi:hypothetical protein